VTAVTSVSSFFAADAGAGRLAGHRFPVADRDEAGWRRRCAERSRVPVGPVDAQRIDRRISSEAEAQDVVERSIRSHGSAIPPA